MRCLAVSGSLRARSSNTSLLRACRLLSPPGMEVILYEGLAAIPPFNPDLEAALGGDGPVAELRHSIAGAKAVLFSTPEYAHGVPGALKNALDWLVGSGELSGKPCALLHASARGVYAQASLREILATMDARLIAGAEVTLTLPSQTLSPEEIAADTESARSLREALAQIGRAVAAN